MHLLDRDYYMHIEDTTAEDAHYLLRQIFIITCKAQQQRMHIIYFLEMISIF